MATKCAINGRQWGAYDGRRQSVMQAGGECRFRRTTDLGGHLLWVDTGRRLLPANFLRFCQVVPSGCLQVQCCMGTPGTASAENRSVFVTRSMIKFVQVRAVQICRELVSKIYVGLLPWQGVLDGVGRPSGESGNVSYRGRTMTAAPRPTAPPAPGTAEHPCLALANSIVTLPGGQRADELDNPENATAWLVSHDLAPEGAGLLAYCQLQLTGLREYLRRYWSHTPKASHPTPRHWKPLTVP